MKLRLLFQLIQFALICCNCVEAVPVPGAVHLVTTMMAEKRGANTKSSSKRLRSLVVQDGEIGVITNGGFESHTNFSFEIIHAVASPVEARISLFGYVYAITTSAGIRRYFTC